MQTPITISSKQAAESTADELKSLGREREITPEGIQDEEGEEILGQEDVFSLDELGRALGQVWSREEGAAAP